MSEDKYQDLDELTTETMEDSEESSEVSTTEEVSVDEALEGEESNDPAEANRQKQVDVWKRRYESGEVELDQIPHKWIQDAVKPQSKPKEVDVESIVQKQLQAEREKAKYEESKAKLKKLGLDKATLTDVISEAKDLNADGVPMWKALDKAMKYHVQQAEEQELRAQRSAMSLPKMGAKASSQKSEDWWKNASDDDILDDVIKNDPFSR